MKLRKILSVFIAAILVTALFAVPASADERVFNVTSVKWTQIKADEYYMTGMTAFDRNNGFIRFAPNCYAEYSINVSEASYYEISLDSRYVTEYGAHNTELYIDGASIGSVVTDILESGGMYSTHMSTKAVAYLTQGAHVIKVLHKTGLIELSRLIMQGTDAPAFCVTNITAGGAAVNDSMKVNVTDSFNIEFSCPLGSQVLAADAVIINKTDTAERIPAAVTIDGNRLIVIPEKPFDFAAQYSITVDGVTDINGRALESRYTLGFTTGTFNRIALNPITDCVSKSERVSERNEGYLMMFNNTYAAYDVDLPAGVFKVTAYVRCMQNEYIQKTELYIDDSFTGQCITPMQNHWNDHLNIDLGGKRLEAGKHTIKIVGYVDGMEVNAIYIDTVDKFAFDGAAAGENELADNAAAYRGTDKLTLRFTTPLSGVKDDDVELFDGSDNHVSKSVSVTDNILDIMLKEVLNPETLYTLRVGDIADKYNQRLGAPVLISFTTGALGETDSGSGTVTVTGHSLDNGIVSIEGTVLSSAGIPIAGRCVKAEAVSPGGVSVFSDTVKSHENGSFDLSVNLEAQEESGRFVFTVRDEYSASEQFSYLYVVESLKERLLNELLPNNTTPAEVQADFESYGYVFGIDVNTDLAGLKDKSLFYAHLTCLTADSLEEVEEEYRKYLLFESLNQTDDKTVAEAILSNEVNCKKLGFDKSVLDLLGDSIHDFYAEAAAIDIKNSQQEYNLEFFGLLNNNIARKYNKTEVYCSARDVAAYPGQGAELDIGFADVQNDVTGLAINIGSSDFSVNKDNTSFVLSADAAYTAENTDSGIKLVITAKDALSNIKSLGKLKVTAPSDIKAYSVNISGTVTYSIENKAFIETRLHDSTIVLDVVKSPSSSPRGGSSGGGGVSGFSSGGYMQKAENNTVTPKSVFEFNDLDSVGWAQKSIAALLSKKIISESEDNKFRPDAEVTREQFVKMMVMALDVFDEGAVCGLRDVQTDAWYSPYVASAVNSELIFGDDAGDFGVGKSITREDMSVIIYRALEKAGAVLGEASDEKFADDEEISDYAANAIYSLKNMRIINGVGENRFDPKGTATRAMAAKVIYKMMEETGI